MSDKNTCTLANVKRITGLHFTTKHTGKMAGMVSISTSVTTNPRCARNAQIEGSICQKCYAAQMSKRYPAMNQPMIRNQEILTSEILPVDKVPLINAQYVRFESFGDLNNETQVANYFQMCYRNPDVNFAIWTKNPDIIANTLEYGWKKPENLNIIVSSLYVNKQASVHYDFVDRVFTVYDRETIEKQGIEINCGAKSCISCRLCYEKNNVRVINEKLK